VKDLKMSAKTQGLRGSSGTAVGLLVLTAALLALRG